MNWRITSFTELQHLPPADRKRLVRQCVGFRGLVWMVLSAFISGGTLAVLAAVVFVSVIGLDGTLAGGVVGVVTLAGAAAVYQIELIRIRGQLLIHLEQVEKRRRLPMCLYCGYSLEGLTSGVCPECGRPFENAAAR